MSKSGCKFWLSSKVFQTVKIIYSKKNYETYEQDLLNALASGQGPDIFSIHNDWLPKFLDKTTPAPEKTFSLRDYKTNFVDVVVEDFTHQDKIYGTALAMDSLGLYYNKDILGSVGIATPPKTWGELSSQVQRIKKADGRGYFTTSGVAMGNTSNINRAVDILYLLMLQKRVQAYTPDKQRPSFADSFQDKKESILLHLSIIILIKTLYPHLRTKTHRGWQSFCI